MAVAEDGDFVVFLDVVYWYGVFFAGFASFVGYEHGVVAHDSVEWRLEYQFHEWVVDFAEFQAVCVLLLVYVGSCVLILNGFGCWWLCGSCC